MLGVRWQDVDELLVLLDSAVDDVLGPRLALDARQGVLEGKIEFKRNDGFL